MKKGISLLLVVAVLVVTMLMGSIAVASPSPSPSSGDSNTAQVYIYPEERLNVPVGQEVTFQVRINSSLGRGAPHETHEPPLGTDKTWTWEVVIEYDPDVVIEVTTEPYRDANKDWFNTFHLWSLDEITMELIDLGPYPTAFLKAVVNERREIAAACSLLGDTDPTAYPLPPVNFPNRWLHEGNYFDLPYTDGIPTANLEYPPGPWTGNYFILYVFKVTPTGPIPAPPCGSYNIHIKEANFICFDAWTKYLVETRGARISAYVETPEFPLGAEYALWIGLVAAVVYIWWINKRKTKPIVAKRFTTKTPSQ